VARDAAPGQIDAAALQASFDYALNGILEAEADGRIFACNPAASSILGVPRRRVEETTLAKVLAPAGDALPRWERHCATVAEQGVGLVTLTYARAGEPRLLEIASVDIGEGRCLHIIDDITEQRALTASLEAARRAADEANAAKSAFLAHMSHEIRTPLNGIIGLERLLRLTPLTTQQAEYLGDLRRAAGTLLALLGDVLDVSKIEAGRFELENRPFDADEFLETVAAACGPPAAEKNLRVIFDIAPEIPRRWQGDPLRLAQAVNNLLANAIKFTSGGEVALTVDWEAAGDSRGRLRLAVRDTGIGMSAEQVAAVFSPFVQADASVTRRFGGTGLGLAIARGVVERMGGSVKATSTPGTGSEFTIDVPMAASLVAAIPESGRSQKRAAVFVRDDVGRRAWGRLLAAERLAVEFRDGMPGAADLAISDPDNLSIVEAAGMTAAVHGSAGVAHLRQPFTPLRLRRAIAQSTGAAGDADQGAGPEEGLRDEYRGHRALVVDDDALSRRVTAQLLAFAGIEVSVAGNGREACERLLATGAEAVGLVVMDVHMPVMDGLAAARALRAAGFKAPIVALTAGVSVEERDNCLAAGMSDWLPKPPELADLEAVLARWLQPGRSPAPDQPRGLPPAPPDTEDLPGIDLAGALRRFLGNREAFDEALVAFVAGRRADVAQAPALAARGERKALADLAHGLAGSAALLGADDLLAAARALEGAAREGDGAVAPAAVGRVGEAFEAVARIAAGRLAR
jgi:signal transduction histidine kinase/CheY-like chemotaxis protein/HPt (histidine-containing phosphotransfer) domain-containing protein